MQTRDFHGAGVPVLMISAGMTQPKKAGNPLAAWHRYLNYGLLGLADRLHKAGYAPRVFHGHFEAPESFVDRLDSAGWLTTSSPVFLSIPSSYAIDWARRACARIRARSPGARIVIGGRWVIGNDGQWIRSKIPDADLVVYGLADDLITGLMRPDSWVWQPSNDRSLLPTSPRTSESLSCMDYSLLEGHQEFTPSFEVSRGCGRGCAFCAEADVSLGNMKDPDALAREIVACRDVYGEQPFRAFLEASIFSPSTAWISKVRGAFERHAIGLRWRTETRVDSMSADRVHQLAELGLRVLDLGLESASPVQLKRMEKTTKPETYLRKAADLLEACHKAGVWAKVNVLLYPGETPETIHETQRWLDQHAACIKGVSVGPLILYRYGSDSSESLRAIREHGAEPTHADALDDTGYVHLHLGPAMSHAESVDAGRALSRRFMTARDYFDLKSFSYLPPAMTFNDFAGALRGASTHDLPFDCSRLEQETSAP